VAVPGATPAPHLSGAGHAPMPATHSSAATTPAAQPATAALPATSPAAAAEDWVRSEQLGAINPLGEGQTHPSPRIAPISPGVGERLRARVVTVPEELLQ
jgi:hypothetical protein